MCWWLAELQGEEERAMNAGFVGRHGLVIAAAAVWASCVVVQPLADQKYSGIRALNKA